MSLQTDIEDILKLENSLEEYNYNLKIEQQAAKVNPTYNSYSLESAERIYKANKQIKNYQFEIESTTQSIVHKKKMLAENIGSLINMALTFDGSANSSSAPQKQFYLVAKNENGDIEVSRKLF